MLAGGGRPSITIGIQPQIALYTVILGGVCAFGWYTEKYRRDEDDIDGQIKRMYRSDIREAHDKLPQMTKTIRGQDVRLDDRMNNMVWGGKASLDAQNSGSTFGGGFGGGKGFKNGGDDDDDDDGHVRVNVARSASETSDDTGTKKRKRRKRKGKKTKKSAAEKERIEKEKAAEQTRMAVVGVTLGAVALAAVSLLSGRSSSR